MKSKEYMIYLTKQCHIKEIRLLFEQTLNKAYGMSVKIYGYFNDKETLLYANRYNEGLY
jgi:hypothetical protein